MIGTGRFHPNAAARGQTLEKGQHRGALVSDLAHGEASFRTGHHDRVLGDIGANIEHSGWALHDVPPLTKLYGAGVETHLRQLAFKSAVIAARFLIDAWWCGWGDSFEVCLSSPRADADISPSTPASSLFQKKAENTIQADADISPSTPASSLFQK